MPLVRPNSNARTHPLERTLRSNQYMHLPDITTASTLGAQPPPEQVDVLIVGGGPAGLTVAGQLLHLAQRGRVALVEANEEPCGGSRLPKVCTEYTRAGQRRR